MQGAGRVGHGMLRSHTAVTQPELSEHKRWSLLLERKGKTCWGLGGRRSHGRRPSATRAVATREEGAAGFSSSAPTGLRPQPQAPGNTAAGDPVMQRMTRARTPSPASLPHGPGCQNRKGAGGVPRRSLTREPCFAQLVCSMLRFRRSVGPRGDSGIWPRGQFGALQAGERGHQCKEQSDRD